MRNIYFRVEDPDDLINHMTSQSGETLTLDPVL